MTNIHSKQELFKPLNLHKYNYIDILRGLAILLVIAVHCAQALQGLPKFWFYLFNYGQLGVQLFFITSALTLCLSMNKRNEKTPFNFYIRRFFRIAPAYYCTIVLYFFWRIATGYYKNQTLQIPEGYSIIGVIENIFFLHGFDPRNFNYIVLGGWSIATEMNFYAIFPFLYVMQNKLGIEKFMNFTIVIIVLSLGIEECLLSYNKIFNDKFGFIYCSILNQISVFLIGIITFQNLGRVKIDYFKILIFIFLNLLSCYLINTKTFLTGINAFIYPILSAIAFLILALWLSNPKYKFDSIISRILIQIGRVSFSMYLLHFLFLDITSFSYKKFLFQNLTSSVPQLLVIYFSVIAITFIFAKLTYNIIEKPCINIGNIFIEKLNQKSNSTLI